MTHPYASETYARSLRHIGDCLPVPEWGCSVLVRPICVGLSDAIGTYPIAVLNEDADLSAGLSRLFRLGLVSVVLVVDDFHRPDLQRLATAFPFFRAFKTHYIRKPSSDPLALPRHHRRALRRATALTRTDVLDLDVYGAEWNRLYADLSSRLCLTSVHQFSPEHTNALRHLPGVKAIGSWIGDELVSAHIWVHHEGSVHSHLGASSKRGYAARAAYAVYAASVEYFRETNIMNFGGASGPADTNDGLVRFKKGFATSAAQSYLCGAILRPAAYAELVDALPHSHFFPAYRAPHHVNW